MGRFGRFAAVALVVAGLLALVVPVSASPDADHPTRASGESGDPTSWFPIDLVTESCLRPLPYPASPEPLTRDGPPKTVKTFVVLDGVAPEAARADLRKAKGPYARYNIDLRLMGFVDAGLPAPANGQREASEAISMVREKLGGARPVSANVVYILTRWDLVVGDNRFVAGQAECIGGVYHGALAFAVGEHITQDSVLPHLTAKIAAHEIGHLLGAHHHYSNCAERRLDIVVDVPPPPLCTLMSPDVGLIRLRFSTLSAMTVRGHTNKYAG